MAPVLGGLIQFKWEVNDRVWPTYLNSGQLELAMMNLIFNARDAMPSGGTISVEAINRSLPLATEDLRQLVVVTVKDTGSGIPPISSPKWWSLFSQPRPSAKEPGWD